MVIELGKKYRDKINKIEGTATGYKYFLHGPSQVLLESPGKENGTALAGWVVESRLVPVDDDQLVNEVDLREDRSQETEGRIKTHVHVYKVVSKAEVDSEEFETIEDAEKEALALARKELLDFGQSDCQFLSVGFKD